ncbi:hypothetical protein Sjap_008482 [Stephania japonica]|uniref:Uncharacterized protein n=1 Tax=Stephania japonica TaxID=461633 RepID=A0AAP0PAX2_9MAGN
MSETREGMESLLDRGPHDGELERVEISGTACTNSMMRGSNEDGVEPHRENQREIRETKKGTNRWLERIAHDGELEGVDVNHGIFMWRPQNLKPATSYTMDLQPYLYRPSYVPRVPNHPEGAWGFQATLRGCSFNIKTKTLRHSKEYNNLSRTDFQELEVFKLHLEAVHSTSKLALLRHSKEYNNLSRTNFQVVVEDSISNYDSDILKWLAMKPMNQVMSHTSYVINGKRF